MALVDELKKKEDEITAKRGAWKTLYDAADTAEGGPTGEQLDALKTSNEELSQLIDARTDLSNTVTAAKALKADLDGLDGAEKEKLEQARSVQRTEKEGEEPWTVKATKALLERQSHRAQSPPAGKEPEGAVQ